MMTDRRLTRPIISLLVPIYDLLGILFPVIFTHMFILNYKTRHCGDICRLHKEAPCALELWMIFWPLGSQNKPGLTALGHLPKRRRAGAPAGRGARRTRTRGPGGRPRTGPGGQGKTPGGPGEDSGRTAAGPAAAGRRQGRAVGGRGGPGQVELQLEVQPAGGGGQAAGKPRTFVGRRGTRRGRDKPGCGPGGPGLAGAARAPSDLSRAPRGEIRRRAGPPSRRGSCVRQT